MYHLPETSTTASAAHATSTDHLPIPSTPTPITSHSRNKPHRDKHARRQAHQTHSLPAHALDFTDTAGSGVDTASSAPRAGLGLLPTVLAAGAGTAKGNGQGKGKTKDRALFNATVLELVKLVQAGLVIFGYGGVVAGDDVGAGGGPGRVDSVQGAGLVGGARVIKLDGLLCDATVEGIQRWVVEVGESCVGVEVRCAIGEALSGRFTDVFLWFAADGANRGPHGGICAAESGARHTEQARCSRVHSRMSPSCISRRCMLREFTV